MYGSKHAGGGWIAGNGRRPVGRMTPMRCGEVWCGSGAEYKNRVGVGELGWTQKKTTGTRRRRI